MCLCFVATIVKVKAIKNEFLSVFGKVIYIDAGHGGKDNGAAVDGVMEDSINMAISKYLLEGLLNLGAYTLMSRTSDYDLADLYDKNRKSADLKKRVENVNVSRPDVFISIHLNTFPSNKVKGPQVFHQNNENSKKLSEYIQQRMNTLTNTTRKTKLGDYYILNKTKATGVLIECGFLSNNEERSKLNENKYQKKIADTIILAIVDYFNM